MAPDTGREAASEASFQGRQHHVFDAASCLKGRVKRPFDRVHFNHRDPGRVDRTWRHREQDGSSGLPSWPTKRQPSPYPARSGSRQNRPATIGGSGMGRGGACAGYRARQPIGESRPPDLTRPSPSQGRSPTHRRRSGRGAGRGRCMSSRPCLSASALPAKRSLACWAASRVNLPLTNPHRRKFADKIAQILAVCPRFWRHHREQDPLALVVQAVQLARVWVRPWLQRSRARRGNPLYAVAVLRA